MRVVHTASLKRGIGMNALVHLHSLMVVVVLMAALWWALSRLREQQHALGDDTEVDYAEVLTGG